MQLLPVFVFVDSVVNAEWCARNLDEAFGLVGCPAGLGLAVLTEFRFGEVVGAINANCLEAVWTKFQN